MQIDPAVCSGDEFDSVGSPIGLHYATEEAQRGECFDFVPRVEVHVQVVVRPSLPADLRINAPPALEPVSAANGVEHSQNGQNLGQGHVGG